MMFYRQAQAAVLEAIPRYIVHVFRGVYAAKDLFFPQGGENYFTNVLLIFSFPPPTPFGRVFHAEYTPL